MKQRSWMVVVRTMGRQRHNHHQSRMMMCCSSAPSASSSLYYDCYSHPTATTRRQRSFSLAATRTTTAVIGEVIRKQSGQRQSLSFSSSSTTCDDDWKNSNSTTTPKKNHPPPPHDYNDNDYDYSNHRHDLLWKDTQQYFLDPQTVLDTTDAELWRHADAILRGWLSFDDVDLQQHHPVDTTTNNTAPPLLLSSSSSPLERVQVCLRILDRLAALLPQGEFLWVSSLLDRQILVQLLLLWKAGLEEEELSRRRRTQVPSEGRYHRHDDSNVQSRRLRRLLTPSFMAAKLDQYRYASLIQPDASIFHILLETAAYNPHYFSYRHGIHFAHGLLLKLVQVTAAATSLADDEDDDHSTTPPLLMDAVSVAIVMKGWIQHGQPHKAEEWLDRIESWQSTSTTSTSTSSSSTLLGQIRPNKIVYTTVLSGWAQQGHAERAMTILHRQLDACQQQQNHETYSSECRPDTQTWNTVLGALAKSKHHPTNTNKNGTANGNGNWVVTQAQQLVDELMPAYDCAPDDHTWTSLMSCYVKHKPSEAKKLLKQLETTKHHHDDTPVPLSVYNAMLQMYAHHGNVQSAIALLERMEAAAAASFETTTTATRAPDEISYNTVLAAYCKLKDPTAALQAEAFWDRHADKFDPSIVTYGTLLECWSQHAKHSPKTAMDRMTAILHEMKDPPRQEGCPLSTTIIKPNATCYNIILKTWAQLAGLPRKNGGGGGKQQQEDPSERVSSDYCLERILELFEEMANSSSSSSNGNNNTRPDDTTFRTILHALIGSSLSRQKRQVILDYVLPKMKRLGFHPKGKKDEELLRRCLKASSSPIRSSPSR